MNLPVCLIQPVSLLETLSSLLCPINLLYIDESVKKFDQLTEENRLSTILRYLLACVPLFPKVLF